MNLYLDYNSKFRPFNFLCLVISRQTAVITDRAGVIKTFLSVDQEGLFSGTGLRIPGVIPGLGWKMMGVRLIHCCVKGNAQKLNTEMNSIFLDFIESDTANSLILRK